MQNNQKGSAVIWLVILGIVVAALSAFSFYSLRSTKLSTGDAPTSMTELVEVSESDELDTISDELEGLLPGSPESDFDELNSEVGEL